MSKTDEYILGNVTYTDGKLIAENGYECCPIMTDEEDRLMYESAKVLCSNRGSVLNVGFGMGIIDTYIRENNPKEHTIIEAHPQVCEKAQSMGFNPICGKWEDVIPTFIDDGRRFDSIYFDTFPFDFENEPQWAPFTRLVPRLINDGGIYSYFNGIASKVEKCEEIVDSFGWSKHMKLMKFSRGEYELIWHKQR